MARQLQEKCRKRHQDLLMVFVGLAKAFDTVSMPLTAVELGCPSKFLSVLRALHDGAETRGFCGGGVSDLIPVSAGVSQECIMAPVVVNILCLLLQRLLVEL